MSRPGRQTRGSIGATATTILTLDTSQHQHQSETLTIELRPRRKKVTWKEGTVDNEFLNRKSSKKCCIFHKQKPFDEDHSDDDDDENPKNDRNHRHDHDHDHGFCSNNDSEAGPSRCGSHDE